MDQQKEKNPYFPSSPGIILLIFPLIFSSCSRDSSEPSPKTEIQIGGAYLSNAPIADFQFELLKIAQDTANKIPIRNHHKDRARYQQKVVEACLELNQPALAMEGIEEIDNWRKQMSYALMAEYCAQHPDTASGAERLLELVENYDHTIDAWRSDSIKSKVSQVYALLGKDKQATAMNASMIEMAEVGKLAITQAGLSDTDAFEEQLQAIEAVLHLDDQNYDIRKNILQAYATLLDRYFDDDQRRKIVLEKIQPQITELPYADGVAMVMQLAEIALDHSNTDEALKFIRVAWKHVSRVDAELDIYGKWLGRLASLQVRAGQAEQAKERLNATLERFEENKESLLMVDRARTIRPLAEAFQTMGDRENALLVYGKTLNEGAVTANSRPKAMDLIDTCISMARSGFDPGEDLLQRMYELHAELDDPW